MKSDCEKSSVRIPEDEIVVEKAPFTKNGEGKNLFENKTLGQ